MVWRTILWCDNFGEKQTPLQRNGMAAIPKRKLKIKSEIKLLKI